jgi:hypothetical protein
MGDKMTQYKECPVCCGEATWYGLAPHSHNVGADGDFRGSTVMVKEKDYPDNFSEDPEAKGCGTYYCKTCDGNGMVNLDGSIIELD